MRLSRSALDLMRGGAVGLALTLGACGAPEQLARAPAAVLVPDPGVAKPAPAPPAIVPLPTPQVVVAVAPEPRQHRYKTIFLRGLSGVGCGRG